MNYEANITLRHNQAPATVDLETGEVRLRKPNNLPEGKFPFNPGAFTKRYPKAWEYLYKVLTDQEIVVALKLMDKAQFNTNSLRPLSDDIPQKVLSQELGVSKNRVKQVVDNLYKAGVYAKATVMEGNETTYWIFNPYLSYSGKLITTELLNLFQNTQIAKHCRGEL